MLQLSHLCFQRFALAAEHLQTGVDGVVALYDQLHILPDVPEGYAGFFHAADDPKPFQIRLAEHPDAAGRPLHKGEQSFFVVVA